VLAAASLVLAAPWILTPPFAPSFVGQGLERNVPAIVADERGGALLAWAYAEPPRSHGLAFAHVGPMGSIDFVERIPARRGESLEDPAIAADQQGRFTIAYQRRTRGRRHRVMVATGTAEGGIGRPRTIKPRGGVAWEPPAVAVAPDGAAVVAWEGGRRPVVEASFRPSGGEFGRPRTLASPKQSLQPLREVVKAGGPGEVAVAWNVRREMRLAVWRRGRLERPVTIGRGLSTLSTPLAMDGDGRTVIAGDNGRGLVAEIRDRTGHVSRTLLRRDAREVAVAGGGAGTAVVISTDSFDKRELQAHVAQGGRFGAPVPIPSPADYVDAAVNAQGAIALGLTVANRAVAVLRPPGGQFSAPELVSPPRPRVVEARVALSGDGAAALGWSRSDGLGTVALRPPG
jgi:hypothetical protein